MLWYFAQQQRISLPMSANVSPMAILAVLDERIGSFVVALRALKRLSELSSNCNRMTDKAALVIMRQAGNVPSEIMLMVNNGNNPGTKFITDVKW